MTNRRHVALGTISFTVCFAAWGLIGAFAPRFREAFHLTASQTALLVAVPVLLGSLARIPMGILTDRFGGRAIFSVLMAAVAIPVWMVPEQSTYSGLLTVAFLLGLAGSSFADRGGLRLAVDAAGTSGQRARSLRTGKYRAVRGGVSWPGDRGAGWNGIGLSRCRRHAGSLGGSVRIAGAQCPGPRDAQRKGLGRDDRGADPREALLAAVGLLLPHLRRLRRVFHLPADAAEGRISPDAGRCRVPNGRLRGAGDAAAPAGRMALRSHRRRTRVVRGLPRCGSVRAAAGVAVDDSLHGRRSRLRGVARAWGMARCSNWCRSISRLRPGRSPGWSAPWEDSAASFRRCCWPSSAARPALSGRVSLCWRSPRGCCGGPTTKSSCPRQQALDIALPADLRRTADRSRAGAWATLWTALLVAAIVVGSRNLQNFDPALVIYTFAVVFATWGVVYHYNVWLEKPPTRLYWDRGWELYRRARRRPQPISRERTGRHSSGRHNASSRTVRACAGGCTSASSGDACWPSRSPFRWSSAGFTSARFPATN